MWAIRLIFPLYFLAASSFYHPTVDRQNIEAVIHRQAWAWENGAVETIVSDFDEDSVFIAAGQEFKGKETIKAAAEDYFRQFTGTKIEIKRIIIEGNSAAVEWNWTDLNRCSNLSGVAEDAIILLVKNQKIVYWREYLEKKDENRRGKLDKTR